MTVGAPAAGGGRVHITVNGVTHDVTDWLGHHPGGSQIIQSYAGRDATDVFMVMHSQQAFEKLEVMARAWPDGAKKVTVEETPLDKDFRKLDADVRREGLYRPSKLWFLYKSVTTIGLGVVSYLVATCLHQYLLAALVMGLMFQQFGWLAHDICHQQAFADRKLGNVVGLLFGAVANGFSPTWWKNKHNTHHATTNVLGADPDIDNLPYLAFDKADLDRARPEDLRMIQYQSWYFHPVLAFLKVSWCVQSLKFVIGAKKNPSLYFRRQQRKEGIALAIHYTWFALFCLMVTPTLLHALMFFVVSELAGGYFIAFVVLMNHMHLPKLHSSMKFPEWVKLQIATTVDVRKGVFTDWFFGGLNYQIEHHCFPNMPRHNLSKVQERLRSLCHKHGVPFEDPTVLVALRDLEKWVDGLARQASARCTAATAAK